MEDLGRLMSWSVSPEIRHNHLDEILNHYYKILKSIAGDKVTASIDQMKEWYHNHFAFNVIYIVTNAQVFAEQFPKSEGEQKKIDQLIFLERMKVAFEDALVIFAHEFL